MENFPKRINAVMVYTYDVDEIITQLRADGTKNPTMEDVVDTVERWASGDFVCVHGHKVMCDSMVLVDENGDEY